MVRSASLILGLVVALAGAAPGAKRPRVTDDPQKLAAFRQLFVPEAYLRPEDQERARELRDGYYAPFPCTHEIIELGFHEVTSLPTDQCFKMTKPQRWSGVWRNDFEGSHFCLPPDRKCTHDTPGGNIWLTFPMQPESELQGRGGLYAVDFVGRRTLYRGMFGHMGGSDYEIIVDRVILMKELEAPPPPPSKEQQMEWMIAEEARGTFFPNAQTKKEMQEYLEEKRKKARVHAVE